MNTKEKERVDLEDKDCELFRKLKKISFRELRQDITEYQSKHGAFYPFQLIEFLKEYDWTVDEYYREFWKL